MIIITIDALDTKRTFWTLSNNFENVNEMGKSLQNIT